jgi:Protein of unknown function (DUF402)
VVEDTSDLTVLWFPSGFHYAMGDDLFGDWKHRPRIGQRPQLRITRRGDPFSVFLFQHEDGSLRGWYVNLERPQRRTGLGFDYEDELLDVWVPSGGPPELLDEDELAEAVQRGFVTTERAAEIQATAEGILANPPWPTGWEEWRPEPGWQIPVLPPRWDTVER